MGLCEAAEERNSPKWHAMLPPNKVGIIGMMMVISQEARLLFETIFNPARRLDLGAGRSTLNVSGM